MNHDDEERRRARRAAWTWLALLALTLLSVLAAGRGHGHAGWLRVAATWTVAALCALKADLLIRHYLEARAAGPVFHRLVRAFAALVPLALAASALREALAG